MLIHNHDYDLNTAGSSIRNLVCTLKLPEATWMNVLLGRPADIDHMLSRQYTLKQGGEAVQKLKLVELIRSHSRAWLRQQVKTALQHCL